jgi:hypothetical protein
VRIWLPGKKKWNFVKCDYIKYPVDGGCQGGTEQEEILVASTRTVALDSVLLPKTPRDGGMLQSLTETLVRLIRTRSTMICYPYFLLHRVS